MSIEFTLPELGENVTTGDVLRVLVKPGDVVALDQPVLELETDKATIEVPSSVAGQVSAVKVKAGDKVTVGQAILSVEDSGGGATTKRGASPERASSANSASKVPGEEPGASLVQGILPGGFLARVSRHPNFVTMYCPLPTLWPSSRPASS